MELASSSSSSSSSSSFLKSEPHFIYDAFINFGGKDIGRRFVSHLHYVLLQGQVKTLIKEENLLEGMKLKEHMRAIGRTKITIIVFSKSYAESTCCLRELEKIIECLETFGQIVLPVFYEIDPLDVRDQKKDFGKALEETAEREQLEYGFSRWSRALTTASGERLEHAMSRWSRALTKAAGITGWDVRNFRHDAELVGQIVRRVQTLLEYSDLPITRFPVGLDSHVEKVIRCIENHSTEVCMIGIWGMAGSGKTTTAKAIYNRIYRQFIGKSFIENIAEVRNRVYRTDVDLQKNLIYDVLKFTLKVESHGMGRTMIETEFSLKKLLIVLDDVNEFGQLENVCGNREWFGQGTVIIITTRDVGLLNRLKVDYVYKMDGMNESDSLELFSCHAFGEAKPRTNLNELARNIVAHCGGLPLTLHVFGSFLCDRTMEEWESVLSKLKTIPTGIVQEKLKISFDGLHDMEQDIFLDVCFFFIGMEKGYVTEMLNNWQVHADIGITVLIKCGLIQIERNNKLEMHPLLQDMGREIIRKRWPKESWKRSLLWFQGDVKDVPTKNIGTS